MIFNLEGFNLGKGLTNIHGGRPLSGGLAFLKVF